MEREVVIEVKKMIADRPKDARPRIFKKFENLNCLDCGQCCKKKADKLFVARIETAYEIMRNAAKDKEGISFQEDDGVAIVSFDSDMCRLIEENNICSIYEDRPAFCRIFPFAIHQMNDKFFMSLTSHCPPLAELKREGIEFLYMSDVMCKIDEIEKEIEKYPESAQTAILDLRARGSNSIGPTLLVHAITEFALATRYGIIPRATILHVGDEEYFPIL